MFLLHITAVSAVYGYLAVPVLLLQFQLHLLLLHLLANNNRFAQSNLGRGPRRGAVTHVRRKVPIGYNGAPQKYPFPWTDPQTALSTSPLDPSGSDPPFSVILITDGWTDEWSRKHTLFCAGNHNGL